MSKHNAFYLQARKEKEREEKEKRKEKERKEKDREREKEKGKERSKKDDTDSENIDVTDSHGHKEDKKREKDRERKHRKRHQSATDDMGSDKDEKEESKKRKHSSDRKRSRKVLTSLYVKLPLQITASSLFFHSFLMFIIELFLMFLGSMHTHLNQTAKASIKSIGESTGSPVEMDMTNLKMGSLVRTKKTSSSVIL